MFGKSKREVGRHGMDGGSCGRCGSHVPITSFHKPLMPPAFEGVVWEDLA